MRATVMCSDPSGFELPVTDRRVTHLAAGGAVSIVMISGFIGRVCLLAAGSATSIDSSTTAKMRSIMPRAPTARAHTTPPAGRLSERHEHMLAAGEISDRDRRGANRLHRQ